MNEEKAKKKKPRGEDAKEHKKPWEIYIFYCPLLSTVH
jgi:hypothetical protein